ncbi:allatostatin-A receptor-like [Porites lutea]|uniref:allatostatin-A receptor-like n=1 Tax=Porites lutea TaxID=51062 RepID=UPI003CC64962
MIFKSILAACSIMVGVNLLGNSLVCFVVLKNKSMRTTMNFLLVNLAVSDMIVGFFSIFRFLLNNPFESLHGTAAHVMCTLLTGGNLMWTGLLASVLFLVLIAVERYHAVLHPLHHQSGFVVTKLKSIVTVLWIYAFVWQIPAFSFFRYSNEVKQCVPAWPDTFGYVRSVWWVISTAVIPVIMMGYLYTQIVLRIWKTNSPGVVGNGKVRRKITRMTLIISVIYILTWIPNSVIFLLLRFTDHVTPNSPVDQLGILLVTFNSCVNPIVYTLHSTRFRQCIRSMLLCKPRFSRNAIAPVAYATTHQRVEQDVDVTSYDNEDFVENGLEYGSQLERSRQSVSNESTSSCRQN